MNDEKRFTRKHQNDTMTNVSNRNGK